MQTIPYQPDQWREILKEITEVARYSLKNIVSQGLPPLPSFYEKEFLDIAAKLRMNRILEAASKDREIFEKRLSELVTSSQETISGTRNLLETFNTEARACLDELDSQLDRIFQRNDGTPDLEIASERDLLRDMGERFTRGITLTLNGLKRHEETLADLACLIYEDPLTQILNRRSWDRDLEAMLADMTTGNEKDKALTVVLADLDHFKVVNDSHGHLVGDAVLRQFAALLKEDFRSVGKVYRYGGEEFGIIIPGLSQDDVIEKVESFRERLSRSRFTANHGQIRLPITASFGLCTWRHGMSTASLVDRADKALYAAKNAGRNCVRAFGLPRRFEGGDEDVGLRDLRLFSVTSPCRKEGPPPPL